MERHTELSTINGGGQTPPPKLHCGGCGRRFADHQAFCAGCGLARPPAVTAEPPVSAEAGLARMPTATLPLIPPVLPVSTHPVSPAGPAVPPTRRHRRRALIAGIVVLAVAAAGSGVLLTSRDGAAYDLDASLARADQALSAPADKLLRADKVAAIRAAAAAADASTDDVAHELGTLSQVSDAQQRSAARETLEAESELLAAWAGLVKLADGSPDGWTALAAPVADATETWEKARDRLATTGLASVTPSLRRTVTKASQQTGDYLTASAATLSSARAETARVMADKTDRLGALGAYSAAAHQEVNAYTNLRKYLADSVGDIESGRMTYSEAYKTLNTAKVGRATVRDALSGLSPPAAVEEAHQGLVYAVATAASAVSSAFDGLLEFQRYSSYYGSVTATQGWKDFQSASNGITATWSSSVSAWERDLASETSRLNAITAPPPPAV
jgi:hypothetical protein